MVPPLIHGRDALRGPAQGYRAYLGRLASAALVGIEDNRK